MRKSLAIAGAAVLLAAGPAAAQDKKPVKIGFVSTFSGPTAVIGNDMRNAFELALDHLGHKMAGRPVQVIYEDDQQKPAVGRQKTEKLIQSDHVDFITGYIWSNVMLASKKAAVDAKTFFITANAGAHQIAGKECSPYIFSTSWENDQTPEAMGMYMNQKHVKSAFLIGPNYAAGKDMLAGVAKTYKGKIVGQELTTWPSQLDFSAELAKAKAANPDAVFIFYPGKAGVQFLSQYAQAGLKGKIPLYQVFSIDETTIPLQKDLALGIPGAQEWVNDLPNAANKKFVADFNKKYGHGPSFYGAQSYDAALLIDSAVRQVKDLSDKAAVQKAMEKAAFKTVRGHFTYGNNHIPIQNFYLQVAVKDPDGKIHLKSEGVIVKNFQDRFHQLCHMTTAK
ncbi:MAG TPA: ABC transporter substrate-binding protein [Pseudolabrys sp.]|jgi:branched-chain amino acid transport system substrate-binding protein|nr:ABC transporter substrate-binding protein [Pseudolabrys sp.]